LLSSVSQLLTVEGLGWRLNLLSAAVAADDDGSSLPRRNLPTSTAEQVKDGTDPSWMIKRMYIHWTQSVL
jgi:hypothetical protein